MKPGRRAIACLAAGALLGISADLARVGLPGRLGTAIWLGLFIGTLILLGARSADTEISLPLAAAFVGLGALLWRDAPALHALNLLMIAACVVAGSPLARQLGLAARGVTAWALAAIETGLNAAFGALASVIEGDWKSLPIGGGAREVGAAAAGLLLVSPVLLVFGALFASADPLFADVMRRTVSVDPEVVMPHIVVTALAGWASAGVLRALLGPPRLPADLAIRGGGSLRYVTVGTALGGVTALFLFFVLLQARYLFGGARLVGSATTLSYAEYARQGFFELLGVTALTLPLLLVADWALDQRSPRDRARFRGLSLLLLGLLGAIVLSALSRMALYAGMYGLTEDRVYATAFMLLLAAVFAWFAASVLRGKRDAFVRGSLVAAGITLLALNALDPDALIARVNLSRTVAAVPTDVAYLGRLSADAVPEILEGMHRLPGPARCDLMRTLDERWRAAGRDEWNVGQLKARAALERQAPGVRSECEREGPEPETS
ncbi:MAG TPA: DUF4173 domain-containing protein [Gemmatimonadales bacterium]